MKKNKILALIFSLVVIILAFYKKDLKLLLFLFYMLIPFIFKLNNSMTFLYLIFGFLSIFLGSLIGLFRTTNWYDTLIHFTWGIVASFTAVYLLNKIKIWDLKSILFNILFIFLFSQATSALWEIGEFTLDSLFNMDSQRRMTGVYDTMKDLIAALTGNMLFISCFWYEYKYSHKLLIHQFLKNI